MLPRYRCTQLLWLLLLVCGLFVFGSDRAEAEEALSSWYGPGFDGLTTASGETFDADGLSTAHRTLPMGTELIVSYDGKSVPVTVNDRGPFTGNRELDLSQGAAEALGLTGAGVDYVEVTCANGGIYPNCTPGVTGPPNDIVVEEVTPAYDPIQDTTAVQEGIVPQDGIAAQGGTTVQVGPTVQGGNTVQDWTIVQDSTALQDGTTVQDGGSGVHVIQSGETLTGIAAQLGISIDDLLEQNGITDPNLIYAGQPLYY